MVALCTRARARLRLAAERVVQRGPQAHKRTKQVCASKEDKWKKQRRDYDRYMKVMREEARVESQALPRDPKVPRATAVRTVAAGALNPCVWD